MLVLQFHQSTIAKLEWACVIEKAKISANCSGMSIVTRVSIENCGMKSSETTVALKNLM